ncbi:MAG: glutamyl-tRNA reductase [Chitinophagaceae bacterium]
MQDYRTTDISKFFAAGINYKKTDASRRGLFAINNDQYQNILQQASENGIRDVFVLSTCNRTEIYGIAETADQLLQLICSETTGTIEEFTELAYIKKGIEAVEHLFHVGAGLDSQILGDYEIVGQLKNAVRFSKENGFIQSFTERLVNAVLQSSKEIKNQTALSGGTVSVSFAAVQYIRENVQNVADKKILLIGTGKIGRNTCKNLADYLEADHITLLNRTNEKAEALATELGLKFAPYKNLSEEVAKADVILVATDANEPVIKLEHVVNKGRKLLIDLSVPYNVEESTKHLNTVTLINVDDLSKMKDETLARRQAEVPKAKAIIAEHIAEFMEWYEMRKHVPVLKAVKTKLEEIHTGSLYTQFSTDTYPNNNPKIQQVINGLATKMRKQNQKGCYYIEAINEFIAPAGH